MFLLKIKIKKIYIKNLSGAAKPLHYYVIDIDFVFVFEL